MTSRDKDSSQDPSEGSPYILGCVLPLAGLLFGWGSETPPLGVLLWLTASALYQAHLQGRLPKSLGYGTLGALIFMALISWLISSPPDRLPAILVLLLTYGAEKGPAIFWMLMVGVGFFIGLGFAMRLKAESDTSL